MCSPPSRRWSPEKSWHAAAAAAAQRPRTPASSTAANPWSSSSLRASPSLEQAGARTSSIRGDPQKASDMRQPWRAALWLGLAVPAISGETLTNQHHLQISRAITHPEQLEDHDENKKKVAITLVLCFGGGGSTARKKMMVKALWWMEDDVSWWKRKRRWWWRD